MVLVTGGAGFIGSAVVRRCLGESGIEIVNLDKLTYASSEETLRFAEGDPEYTFEHADVCDGAAVRRIFAEHRRVDHEGGLPAVPDEE